MKSLVLGILCLSMLAGCSTAKLTETGSKVEVVTQLEQKGCKNLGPVYGKGGGAFGGSWISDESLMEYATNDIRNKAAAKGASHVVILPHQMGHSSSQYGGSTSTASITGVAYLCP